MKIRTCVTAVVVAASVLPAFAATVSATFANLAPEAPPFHDTAVSGAQSSVRTWIVEQSSAVRRLDITAAEQAVRKAVGTRFATETDRTAVEALIAATLIRAAQENEKDLKALAARIDATLAAREALRQLAETTRKLIEESSGSPDTEVCKVANCALSDIEVNAVVDAQRRALVPPLRTPVVLKTVGELRNFGRLLSNAEEDIEAERDRRKAEFQKAEEAQAAAMRRLVELVRAIGAIRTTVISNLK